ncbi:MAG TPA: hypothetical protein VGN48_16395 [Pedococcus sp.]|jgi:hypothetical protein|nr:hypothetical protein [Pedococcus sp.]
MKLPFKACALLARVWRISRVNAPHAIVAVRNDSGRHFNNRRYGSRLSPHPPIGEGVGRAVNARMPSVR